ncbi:hypothetical protein A4U49_02790 [Acidithiobacillus ferrivorans]|jgi:hypothetical protein|nr:hypothetical protein A4U49_02790 [Acidithiobacillus ferrivorans]
MKPCEQQIQPQQIELTGRNNSRKLLEMSVNFGVVFRIARSGIPQPHQPVARLAGQSTRHSFLLVLGILLGPILGWLRPDKIFGPLLFLIYFSGRDHYPL